MIYFRYICFITCLIVSVLTNSYAWQPDPGSPLGDKVHPRLLFVPESVGRDTFGIKISDVRSRANGDPVYKGYIQTLIAELDSNWYARQLTDDKRYITFNCMNFAFLYILDPATVSGLSTGHSREEYGDEAIRQALYLASRMNEVNDFETRKNPGSVSINMITDLLK